MKILYSFFRLSLSLALCQVLVQPAWSQQKSENCNTELETLSTLYIDHKDNGSKWSKSTPLQTMTLSLFPERNALSGVNQRAYVDIQYALAKNPAAPLVFIQSGLGGTGESSYNFYLMGILHEAGFNVVSVPSQYFWRMSLATSLHMRPGYKDADLTHLAQVYQSIRQSLEKRKLISETAINHFVGISNGAYNGIQIANQKQAQIRFEKFVAINPPLDLFYGVQTLDQLFLDGKKRVSHAQYDKIMGQLTLTFTNQSETLEEKLQRIQKAAVPQDLRYIIARQLIESVQETAVASQIIENQDVFKNSAESAQLFEARSWSIQDYQDRILLPYFTKKNVQSDAITKDTSVLKDLKSIAQRKNLLLLHSLNDFISRPSDILAAKKILGQNAVITQCGGHVGALVTPTFSNALLHFLK
jgi:predicted alpha/beta-fold hydrolase